MDSTTTTTDADSLTVPPPSLKTLSPELLHSIFSYLSFRDCLRLLTTSKLLYPFFKESLWSTIGFTQDGCYNRNDCRGCADCEDSEVSDGEGYDYRDTLGENKEQEGEKEEVERLEYPYNSTRKLKKKDIENNYLKRREWLKLIEITKNEYLAGNNFNDRLGWGYTKNLVLHGAAISYEGDLVEMLVVLIATEMLRPRHVYLDLRGVYSLFQFFLIVLSLRVLSSSYKSILTTQSIVNNKKTTEKEKEPPPTSSGLPPIQSAKPTSSPP
ncbi:hypothetical protein TWF506_002353 [Arthrobotrys conoides]|uniref:F-box domain-containing protein n=1 Tax=Arthrobotrys conoides TaxID=74498 RepID=A0AAN8RLD8_9PEZI